MGTINGRMLSESASENDFQNNYEAGQDYWLRNLCDTCEQEMPICNSSAWKYGRGRGNDNIRECNGYRERKEEL